MKHAHSFRVAPRLLVSHGFLLFVLLAGCTMHYGFSEKGGINLKNKTVNIHPFNNLAPYVNTRVVPALNDRLRQKIVNQTKLTQTNRDSVDYDISGTITDYSASTSGISSVNGQSQTSINRLTVTVHIVVIKSVENKTDEFDVTHQFDFPSNQSLQQAEDKLLDEIIRNLTDEIFNHIFSSW